MKRSIIALLMVLATGVSAQAQMHGGMMGEKKEMGHGMMMGGEQQVPMMQHMMQHGMMMQEMMQMMMDMMKMQQKMVEGVKPAEKKKMQKELAQMMERMNKMMAEMKGMAAQGMMMQEMMGGMQAEPKKEELKHGPTKTQEKSEAGVTVKVSREGSDGTVSFKVALETHTVDLDRYKFDEIVALRAGGKEYPPRVRTEEGSGHHRSAVVEFDKPKTGDAEVVIKGVAGVKERVFPFQL